MFVTTRIRQALGVAALLLAGSVVMAQRHAPVVAVPYYTPAHFMQGLYRGWYGPRSAEFALRSAELTSAVQRLCRAAAPVSADALEQARAQWRSAARTWDRLAYVAIGPLVQRRSARQIDFTPTRPELIVRAIDAAPSDAQAMERIGAPAKGLPALEWLLWTRPTAPGTPACGYAEQVAADIGREATALADAFANAAARTWSDEEAVPAMSEAVNQWVGALERLRWQDIERPLRSAGKASRNAAAFPRAASDDTQASRAARWQALGALSALPATVAPVRPGEGLVPLETYLRGRGLNPLADRLAEAVARTDRRMQAASAQAPRRQQDAARELASLKRLAESAVAPALNVNLGFSSSDGD
jgi:predicted lipoprotein